MTSARSPRRRGAAEPTPGASPRGGRPLTPWARLARPRLAATLWLVACPAAAALSLLLSAVPHFDPFAWTIWGREITHPDVGLSTVDGPSWKPLPVLFTTPLSLLGDAAPAGWLVIARTAALLTIVLAYRLGRRFGSRAAGTVAAGAVVVIPGWFQEQAFGGELGPLLALMLGAIDRHLAGRRDQALLLGFGAALLRPETWPFLLAYTAWAMRTKAVDRRLACVVLVLVPTLWFVPDWVTLGDPFRGSGVARASTEARTDAFLEHPLLEVLRRAYGLVPLPLQLLALVAVTLAVRRRAWALVVMGAGALGWVGLVAVLAAAGGFTGLPRFMVPAAAVVSILAAVGAVHVVDLVAGRRRHWARPAVGLVLAAALVPSGAERARGVRDQARTAQAWERSAVHLERAVGLAGGPDRVACRRPVIKHPGLTELAWLLGLPIAGIRTDVVGDSVVFVPRHGGATDFPPVRVALPRRLVARTGEWEVYEFGAPSGPCPARFRG